MFLPKIICSSVVRTSKPGDSHGGIFLVDLEKGTHKEVFNWANRQISWEGRGGDRGLRGICFYEQYVICAASNELMFFNHDFEIVERYSNPYLKSCHEIFIEGKTMYLSSTGFDAILTFDLESKTFRDGYCFRKRWPKNSFWRAIRKHRLLPVIWRYVFYTFSCNGTKGPSAKDTTHINNVFARNGRIYFSGTEVNSLFEIGLNKKVKSFRNIHKGTHNVSLLGTFVFIIIPKTIASPLFHFQKTVDLSLMTCIIHQRTLPGRMNLVKTTREATSQGACASRVTSLSADALRVQFTSFLWRSEG